MNGAKATTLRTARPTAVSYTHLDENKRQITTGITDENGVATFSLGYGKYFYHEIAAPEEYIIDDTLYPDVYKRQRQASAIVITLPISYQLSRGSSLSTSKNSSAS